MNWKFLNFTRKTRLMITASIGVLIILLGISEGVFHYWISMHTANEICLFLMIVAVGVLFSGRGRNEEKEQVSSEADSSKDEEHSEKE